MDSGLDTTLTSSGARRSVWPGLWVPTVLLVLGVTLSLAIANLVASQAEELARRHYQAKHQAIVNLIASQLQGQASSADNAFEPLKAALTSMLPEHLSLRVDTLERHTKKPVLEIGSAESPLSSHALRSELDAAGGKWMVTTLPGTGMLAAPVQNLHWIVLSGGLTLTALAVALALYLCRMNFQHQQAITRHQRKQLGQNQQMANLQVEKTVLRQALNESESRSRDLVTLSGAITAELDDLGQIGFISSLVADLLGLAPSDLDQRPFSAIVAEADQHRFDECLQASHNDHTVARVDLTLVGHGEQALVPVMMRIKALKDPVQGVTGYRLSAQPA